jgi:hypothetical protein
LTGSFTIENLEGRPEQLENLHVFRLLDDVDQSNQRHHGYEIGVMGDLRAVGHGHYSATLISDTEIVVELPTATTTFLEDYDTMRAAMIATGTHNDAAEKAHVTARSGMLSNPDRKTLKFLVRIRTGEKLTNAVYSPNSVPTGEIYPTVTPFTSSFTHLDGRTYQETKAWISWKVARVEHEKRMAIAQRPPVHQSKTAAFLHGVIAAQAAANQGMQN